MFSDYDIKYLLKIFYSFSTSTSLGNSQNLLMDSKLYNPS